MFSYINRTVWDIPISWDRTRFEDTRAKYRQARKLIEISINVQFERQLKIIQTENVHLEKNIAETTEHLSKHPTKIHIFENLTKIAAESLSTHVDRRMENVRTNVEQHFKAIQILLREEKQYWQGIHSAIDQNLITSTDIRQCEENISQITTDDLSSPFERNFSVSSDDIMTMTKAERVSVVLSSINKTYLIKPKETTNRISPTYSQPNPPIPLYLSPTLHRNESSKTIRHALSPIDQNQLTLMKPRIILHRVGQPFLIDYLKTEENHQQTSFALSESASKPQKRKKSALEDKDVKSNHIALRKRKCLSIVETNETKPTKQRNKRQMLIRESSRLPPIDRAKHYHTRFSTRQ